MSDGRARRAPPPVENEGRIRQAVRGIRKVMEASPVTASTDAKG